MTTIQFNSHNGLVLNANIDESAIFGHGTISPRLSLVIRFEPIDAGTNGVAFELSEIQGDLAYRDGSIHEPIGSTSIYRLSGLAHNATQALLTFPIPFDCVQWLENMRAGGERLPLFLNLGLTAKKLQTIERPGCPAAYAYISESTTIAQGTLTIPRDTWCTRVLEGTKFGTVHFLEFPAVQVEQCSSLTNAFAALKEASRLHRLGFYDQAVGQCRVALDKFWDKGGPKKLQESWIGRLGNLNHKWLHEIFATIRREANEPHHNTPSGFSQFESQLFIGLTTSFVAYVARAGVTED